MKFLSVKLEKQSIILKPDSGPFLSRVPSHAPAPTGNSFRNPTHHSCSRPPSTPPPNMTGLLHDDSRSPGRLPDELATRPAFGNLNQVSKVPYSAKPTVRSCRKHAIVAMCIFQVDGCSLDPSPQCWDMLLEPASRLANRGPRNAPYEGIIADRSHSGECRR